MTTSPDPDPTSTAKNSRRRLTIGAIIVVVVLIAAAVAWSLIRDNDSDAPDEPAAAPTETPQDSSGDDGEDVSGAYVGNTQRHWPRDEMPLDDSGWGTPGEYATDPLGRPLWIPEIHDGDIPNEQKKKDAPGKCDDTTLSGGVQQQYANGRFLAVNDSAGPFNTDYGVPAEFAHSPQGAIMAAINAVSFSYPDNYDEIGLWAAQKVWDSERSRDVRRAEYPDNNSDILTEPAAPSYNVLSCSDDVVVVELSTARENAEEQEVGVYRIPMIWRDGDWMAVVGPEDESGLYNDNVDTSDFEEVSYQ